MKKVNAIIMGFGDRGQIYASYAKKCPERFAVVGVVDPNPVRLEKAKREYGLSDGLCFSDPTEFYRRDKLADAVVNATMDSLHYETTLPLLEKGYHVLLEKPVTSDPAELFALRDAAKRSNVSLMVCHVLRYAPFYRKIKEELLSGAVGKITHVHAAENVAVYHILASYVRGKWNSEKACGSGMLMAKCCHDLDLLVWLTGMKPEFTASIGGRSVFTSARKPAGAGTRCLVDCKIEKDCPYSAKKLFLDHDVLPFLIWADVPGKDFGDVDKKTRIELLKTVNPHGACAYEDRDLVDHQSVLVEFEGGATAELDMTGAVAKPGRSIHIVGDEGEIEGFLEDNRYVVRRYLADELNFSEREVKITDDVSGAHSGGDLRLAADFAALVAGEPRSISCTDIDDSVAGHLLTIAAERSRKEKRFVSLRELGG